MIDDSDRRGRLKTVISVVVVMAAVTVCFQCRYDIMEWLQPHIGNVLPGIWVMTALVASVILLPVANLFLRSWRISSFEVLLLTVLSFALVGAFIGAIFGIFYQIDEYPLWQHTMLAMMALGAVAAVACLLVPDPKFDGRRGFVKVDGCSNPRLDAIYSELCRKAGVDRPLLYVGKMDSFNAFAFGKYRKRQGIVILEPLLEIMDDEEIEGILGHELSHLMHHDSAVKSITSTCARTLTMFSYVMGILALVSSLILGAGGSKSSRKGDEGMAYLFILLVLIPVIIVGAVLWISVPLAMMVMTPGMSRTREFGADEGSAMITGNPLALARALMKLEHANSGFRTSLKPGVTTDLMISDPFSGSRLNLRERLMSTHPSTAERVARLETIHKKMNG